MTVITPVTFSTFFRYYMFHSDKAPSKKERIITAIASAVLGILSLGLIHIICFGTLYNRNIFQIAEKKEEDRKISETFNKTVKPPEKEKEEEPLEEISYSSDMEKPGKPPKSTPSPDKPPVIITGSDEPGGTAVVTRSERSLTSGDAKKDPPKRTLSARFRKRSDTNPETTEEKRKNTRRSSSLKNLGKLLKRTSSQHPVGKDAEAKETTEEKRAHNHRSFSFKNLGNRLKRTSSQHPVASNDPKDTKIEETTEDKRAYNLRSFSLKNIFSLKKK